MQVDNDGVLLDVAPAGDPSNPPLLFLHGITASKRAWASFVPRMTGRFRVLEVNARYNLWHYLAAANGLNLPLTAYDYLVHGKRPAAPRPYRTTHRWLYLRSDWLAYRQLSARGELSLRQWLRSLLQGPKVCQIFSWRDPLPFLYRLNHLKSRVTPRLGGKLRRWLSAAS